MGWGWPGASAGLRPLGAARPGLGRSLSPPSRYKHVNKSKWLPPAASPALSPASLFTSCAGGRFVGEAGGGAGRGAAGRQSRWGTPPASSHVLVHGTHAHTRAHAHTQLSEWAAAGLAARHPAGAAGGDRGAAGGSHSLPQVFREPGAGRRSGELGAPWCHHRPEPGGQAWTWEQAPPGGRGPAAHAETWARPAGSPMTSGSPPRGATVADQLPLGFPPCPPWPHGLSASARLRRPSPRPGTRPFPTSGSCLGRSSRGPPCPRARPGLASLGLQLQEGTLALPVAMFTTGSHSTNICLQAGPRTLPPALGT